jgi:predicted ABC-type sugar transport system permease subunit
MISGFAECGIRILMAKLVFSYIGKNALFLIEPFAWIAALVFVMVPYYICREKIISKHKKQ